MIDYITKFKNIHITERNGKLYIDNRKSIRVAQLKWLSMLPEEKIELSFLRDVIPMIDENVEVEPIDLDSVSKLANLFLLDYKTGNYRIYNKYTVGSLSWGQYTDSDKISLMPYRPETTSDVIVTELCAFKPCNSQIRSYLIKNGRIKQAELVPLNAVKQKDGFSKLFDVNDGCFSFYEANGVIYADGQPLMRMGQLLWLSQQNNVYMFSLDKLVELIDPSFEPEPIDLLDVAIPHDVFLCIPYGNDCQPYIYFRYRLCLIWIGYTSTGFFYITHKIPSNQKIKNFYKLETYIDLYNQLVQHITVEQADSIISTYS